MLYYYDINASISIYSSVNSLPVYILLEFIKLSTSAGVGSLAASDYLKSVVDRLHKFLL